MDIEQRDDEKLGGSRTLVSKKNVEKPWTDKVSTSEVFRIAAVGTGLMQDMIRRQMAFIGHVVRKDELEKVVLTGYVEGTHDGGKQRETFLAYLSKHNGIKPSEMIRKAIDRDIWIQLCRT